jgi:site-specific DNA recombinase
MCRSAKIRQTTTDADTKIARYRATLDAGGGPALIASWITETTAIKNAAQVRLDLTDAPPQRMTEDQLDAIATAFEDLLRLVQGADPRDRAELHSRIGLRMTYQPGLKTLKAEVVSDDFGRVYNVCPRGDLNPHVR